MINDKYVMMTVCETYSKLQALNIEEILKKSGIPVELDDSGTGNVNDPNARNEALIKIKIPEEYYDQVKELLGTVPKTGEVFFSPPQA